MLEHYQSLERQENLKPDVDRMQFRACNASEHYSWIVFKSRYQYRVLSADNFLIKKTIYNITVIQENATILNFLVVIHTLVSMYMYKLGCLRYNFVLQQIC